MFKYKVKILIIQKWRKGQTRKSVSCICQGFTFPSFAQIPFYSCMPSTSATQITAVSNPAKIWVAPLQLPSRWVQQSCRQTCHCSSVLWYHHGLDAKNSWGCSWWQWWDSGDRKTGDLEPLACRGGVFRSFENTAARERGMQADCMGMKEPLL